MFQHWQHHFESITNAPLGTRQIDHQTIIDHPGDTARQRGRGDSLGSARSPDRFGYPRDLLVQQRAGHFGGLIGRRQPRPTSGEYDACSRADQRRDRRTNRVTVGYD